MGCGASSGRVTSVDAVPVPASVTPENAKNLQQRDGILIERAEDLRDADTFGTSDPYVLVRLGAIGTAWDEKSKATERRSHTVDGTTSPVFQFAFSFTPPPEGKEWEVQARIYDDDLLSADDFLGEATVSLSALHAHTDELRAYPLSTPRAADKARKGSVTMMTGARVQSALLAELQAKVAESERLGAWGAIATPMASLLQKLGEFFGAATLAATVEYSFNMARLAMSWSKAPAPTNDPATAFMLAREDPQRQWHGPYPSDCVTLNSHAAVATNLASLGERLGTTDGNGTAERENFLGMQALEAAMWPGVPWGIGLGAPTETHAWVRPIIVRLCGPAAFVHLATRTRGSARTRAERRPPSPSPMPLHVVVQLARAQCC